MVSVPGELRCPILAGIKQLPTAVRDIEYNIEEIRGPIIITIIADTHRLAGILRR